MGRAIRVLLIDDNTSPDFFEPLADRAMSLIQCDLTPVATWEDALRLLDNDPYHYHGLIIDGKGQKNAGSKGEDNSFLATVLPQLKERLRLGLVLPYVIYSAWAEQLRSFFSEEPIFWKGREEDEMLLSLKDKIVNSELYQCRQQYPEIFELFDLKLLNSKYEKEMVNILNLNFNNYTGNRELVFRSVRPIMENTFYELNKFDDKLVAPKFFQKGVANIAGIIKYLAGSPFFNKDVQELEFHSEKIIPLPLFYSLTMLQDVTSSTAMHHIDKNPSDYLLRSCTNALIDHLLWYKQFVKNNYLK